VHGLLSHAVDELIACHLFQKTTCILSAARSFSVASSADIC
jgi:hypothetical protein